MRSGAFRWCWGWAALLLAVLACSPAQAFGSTVGDPVPVCVRRAGPTVDVRAVLARPRGFDCRTPQRAWGPGDYLVLSAPLSYGRGLPVRARSGALWQERATLYALYADGHLAAVASDGHDLTCKLQLGAIVEDALPARRAAIVRLLWHVRGAANMRGIVLDPHLASPAQSDRANILLASFYAAFAGLCAALLVYNFALWGALRHQFQLAYCGMVAMLVVYAFSSSGALAWAWPELHSDDRCRINYLALAMSSAAALAFARSFFEPRVFAGWLGRAATIVSVALLGSALLWAGFVDWWPAFFDRLYYAAFGALMLLVAPTLWRAWRLRSDYLWLFCVAWGAPILCGALRVAVNLRLLEVSFWLDNSTILAMVAEAVLSSLAIAYRIMLLSRERDRARADESEARRLAAIDPLTGLLNRRAFLQAAVGREGEQVLLLLDVDHFKRVNDTVGHDAGDEVLRTVARALASALPAGALVARVGGEEFAVVSAVRDPVDPAALLARLRAERMPFDLEVTASIGVAAGPLTREADWKSLYRAADQALLDAKASGRDRIRRALALAA